MVGLMIDQTLMDKENNVCRGRCLARNMKGNQRILFCYGCSPRNEQNALLILHQSNYISESRLNYSNVMFGSKQVKHIGTLKWLESKHSNHLHKEWACYVSIIYFNMGGCPPKGAQLVDYCKSHSKLRNRCLQQVSVTII